MRILIYESLPDIERAAFVNRLRRYLINLGHEVFCLVDEKTCFNLDHGQGSLGIIDSYGPMCHYVVRRHRLTTFVYSPTHIENEAQHQLDRTIYYLNVLKQLTPDRVIVWNGLASHHLDFLSVIHELGWQDRLGYVEVAWLPQKDFIYCDRKGINGHSSIASQHLPILTVLQEEQLNKALKSLRQSRDLAKDKKLILVPLQLENDTSIIHFSPFKTMQDLINALEKWIPNEYKVIVRPHPKCLHNTLPKLIRPNFTFDSRQNLYDSLAISQIVIGINSTVLLEAMTFDCKVFAFGKGVFSCVDGIAADIAQDFTSQALAKQNYKPLLYDLLFNRQIPVNSLTGIERFLGATGVTCHNEEVNSNPYSIGKFAAGEAKYWLGRLLHSLGAIK